MNLLAHICKLFEPGPRVAWPVVFPDDSKDDLLIERYSFSVAAKIKLGVPSGFLVYNRPDACMRPKTIRMNAVCPGFVLLSGIYAGNIRTLYGSVVDAFVFNEWVGVDIPTMTHSTKIKIIGHYTGLVPEGFKAGDDYLFAASVSGPATVYETVMGESP